MPLDAGSCTIDADKNVGGTGLARALADAMMAPPPEGADSNKMLEQWCNRTAAAIVEHLVANASVTVVVATGTAGLQRTPNPNDPSTPTLGPADDVALGGTIA